MRTVAVLVQDGKILVQRDRDGQEYALPGGHIKISETLEAGLIREFKEETGADITCIRLLWTEECFWEWNGRKAHNLAFYYLVEVQDEDAFPYQEDFVSQKDNCNVVLGWMPLEKLENVVVYPRFLKQEIHHLDGPMKHFVSKDG